jgi:hypothetical protein
MASASNAPVATSTWVGDPGDVVAEALRHGEHGARDGDRHDQPGYGDGATGGATSMPRGLHHVVLRPLPVCNARVIVLLLSVTPRGSPTIV